MWRDRDAGHTRRVLPPHFVPFPHPTFVMHERARGAPSPSPPRRAEAVPLPGARPPGTAGGARADAPWPTVTYGVRHTPSGGVTFAPTVATARPRLATQDAAAREIAALLRPPRREEVRHLVAEAVSDAPPT